VCFGETLILGCSEGVQDDVLGALSDEERATLHALLLRAAGGQLHGGSCAEAAGCAEAVAEDS
jgi:hypothetical protein